MSAEISRFIMWDMAGTLIPFDTVTGRPRGLPECGDFLPELARDYRMICTTGDSTAGARGLLANFEILPHLETVFGDLNQPVGKPYGEILRQLEGEPPRSLAIGDRLRADIPSDTPEVLTVLINQDGQINSAGMVSYLLHILNRQDAADLPTAFRHLTITAAIDKEAVGPRAGGRVTSAWRRNDGFDYCLWVYEHDALDGERLVIRLGGCLEDD
ncbi:HAD family hydrolase [bacterium]|nr:HAD family hydrolase [bacterium]